MDSDIGGILENLWGGDAQKNSLFCVRFRTLRYSKLAKICVMRKMTHCLSRYAASLWHFSHAFSRFLPA